MKFTNTRGIFSIELDNGITVMSIRDYAFMVRDSIANVRGELAIDIEHRANDVADFVFMKTDVDSDDDVLLGIQYHSTNRDCYYAVVSCKRDCYCTYDEMVERLLNQ